MTVLQVPGGLLSWLQREKPAEEVMPPSSFYRSYNSLSNLLVEVSRYMPEWQRQLVHHLHANYGHESPSSALSAKRKGDMGEFQQIL